MKESLTKRVGRIISSGAHAFIDAIEDSAPEAVLHESLREIDSVIADIRAELGTVIAAKHRASVRLMEENNRHEDLSNKIELAVASNSDDLASAAIEFQLDIEAQIPVLEGTINECASKEAELEKYITALQARKREMKSELNAFIKARKTECLMNSSSAVQNVSVASHSDSRVAQAESVFADVMERTDGVASAARSDLKSASRLAELDDLARRVQVEERLNSVKQRAV